MPVKFKNDSVRNQYHERILQPWGDCTRCPLGASCITHVLGRGKLPCEVLFLGEAPGPQEDIQGEPFVGRSGKLLNRLINASWKSFRPYSYFIDNTIACFPEDPEKDSFRPPFPQEIEACLPRVLEIIEIASPRLIVHVGKVPGKLPNLIRSLNRAWWDLTPYYDHHITILHPSYILRNGGRYSLPYKKTLHLLTESLRTYLTPRPAVTRIHNPVAPF